MYRTLQQTEIKAFESLLLIQEMQSLRWSILSEHTILGNQRFELNKQHGISRTHIYYVRLKVNHRLDLEGLRKCSGKKNKIS